MHCCKLNVRLLRHFTKSIAKSQRYSTPATVENIDESKNIEALFPPDYDIETLKNQPKPKLDEINNLKLEIPVPPVLDLSLAARKRRNRELWHYKVEKLGTVEEKIFELNMPKYYGWKVYVIEEGKLPYDILGHTQYLTRTHLVQEPGLPDYYNNIVSTETLESLVQQIKSSVEDALIFEYNYKRQEYQLNSEQLQDKVLMDDIMAKAVCQQINRILTTHLSSNYNHLIETQMDLDARHEAFWFFGGHEPPSEVRKARRGFKWAKEWESDPINQAFRYTGSPILQLRHNLPLKEIVPIEESEDPKFSDIPVESLDPRQYEYFVDRTRATIIPGFWPGDPSEFGFMSYFKRGYLQARPENFNDNDDALIAQAILSSFSWLYGQACYQGFSTFQDPTYPFVNQAIITNGQLWSFSVYQLNTLTMHIDRINENPHSNICWITEPLKLFESINDSKIEGFNEDVLRHLIKFYINAPQKKENVELKPYLLHGEKLIANIEDPARRKWLESRYKHLMSNRSRHRLAPEIHHWEKIYKIKFKTRPMDKKREPWEFGINPYNRRLNEHCPQYIPKALRPYPKHKQKWEKTYYPTIDPQADFLKYNIFTGNNSYVNEFKKKYRHK